MFSRLSTLLLAVAISGSVFLAAQQPSEGAAQITEGRLARLASQAKAKGEVQVTLPPPKVLRTITGGLDEILQDHTLLRFTVEDAVTTNDGDSIRTWYKLRILEKLSVQPDIPQDDLGLHIPPEFLPLSDSETTYVVHGGTAVINGVSITQTPSDSTPLLREDRQYILVAHLEDGGRFAHLGLSSGALFEIDGDNVKPMSHNEGGITKDMHDQFGNRLSAIRAKARAAGWRQN